jgi:16S rRNA (guanine966-N2)-methyltransferase
MRIHSGSARGRVLKTREGKGTRPTDARARETLFNIIGERVVGARFLDLYAGTGAVGLEALSRGASHCTFVEQNAVACRVIRDNVKMLGWQDSAQVWQSAVKPSLRRLTETNSEQAAERPSSENDERNYDDETAATESSAHLNRFDIVFADPPFTRAEELHELAVGLDSFVAQPPNRDEQRTQLFIVQHHWKAQLALSSRFEAVQQRRAGESVLSFYRLADANYNAVDTELPPEHEDSST